MIDTIERPGLRENYRADIERQLIGCLLIEPKLIIEVGEILQPRDLVDDHIRKLFTLIVSMREAGERVNADSVMLRANRTGLLSELGGRAEYARIVSSVGNAANYLVLAYEVKRVADCRDAELAVEAFAGEIARKDCNPRKAIDALLARVQDLGVTADSKQVPLCDVLTKIYQDGFTATQEFSKKRIATGFHKLDQMIGGLYPQSLVLLGGYFGSGKSTMASDIAARAASNDKSVLLFSIEMTAEEFGQRVLTIEASVSMFAWQRQRSSEEQVRIKALAEQSAKWKFSIDETARQSLSSIRAAARLKKSSRDGLDLLIVDNLTLVNHPGETRDRYKAITIELKKLSRELDCCVLLVAQLNADAVKGEPDSTSWADCKAIEGDADVAMMLHKKPREAYWKPGDLDGYSLIVTKNRSRGDKGKVALTWDGEFQRFSDDDSLTGIPWKG